MNKNIRVAEVADIIINGYAFTKDGGIIRILNLNKTSKATVMSNTGEVLETSMDDIVEDVGTLTQREVRIIREFIKENYKDMYLKWSAKSDVGFYGE